MPNISTPLRISLSAAEVSALIPTKEVFRKVHFVKENKNLALCRYLNMWYVLEHDLNTGAYFKHCHTKRLKDAISCYLEYLCLYA